MSEVHFAVVPIGGVLRGVPVPLLRSKPVATAWVTSDTTVQQAAIGVEITQDMVKGNPNAFAHVVVNTGTDIVLVGFDSTPPANLTEARALGQPVLAGSYRPFQVDHVGQRPWVINLAP